MNLYYIALTATTLRGTPSVRYSEESTGAGKNSDGVVSQRTNCVPLIYTCWHRHRDAASGPLTKRAQLGSEKLKSSGLRICIIQSNIATETARFPAFCAYRECFCKTSPGSCLLSDVSNDVSRLTSAMQPTTCPGIRPDHREVERALKLNDLFQCDWLSHLYIASLISTHITQVRFLLHRLNHAVVN
jgi:hypothetical protein